jgi:hypothetical protein
MRGSPIDPARLRQAQRDEASRVLRASLPPPSRSSKPPSRDVQRQLLEQAAEMVRSGDFRRAGPRHMVAVWAWCHEKTYGVAPAMTAREWQSAGFAAGALLKVDFDGKVEMMVPFLQWTWAEEKRSHAWRKENGRTSSPLGWRLQFSRRHVVKWRANQNVKR